MSQWWDLYHSRFEEKYIAESLNYKLGVGCAPHASSELLVRWSNSFGNPLTHLSILEKMGSCVQPSQQLPESNFHTHFTPWPTSCVEVRRKPGVWTSLCSSGFFGFLGVFLVTQPFLSLFMQTTEFNLKSKQYHVFTLHDICNNTLYKLFQ